MRRGFCTLVLFISSISGSVYKKVLDRDPTIEYYSHEHTLYLLSALIQCLFLAFLPSLLLFLYPTRLYRWISQFISTRKQLAITTFVEALNHGFKDGLNGTRDYRAFAGFLIVGIPMFSLLMWVIAIFAGGLSILVGPCISFLLIHFRPFKSTITNMSVGFYFVLFSILVIAYEYWVLRSTLLWHFFSLYPKSLCCFGLCTTLSATLRRQFQGETNEKWTRLG